MNDLKLKPCPFCGGEAVLVRENKSNEGYLYDLAAIKCRSCACNSGTYLIDTRANTEAAIQRLINAWNKRAPLDTPKIVYCKDCALLDPVRSACTRMFQGREYKYPEDFCSHGVPKILR